MGIPSNRKAVWVLAAVLMSAGLVGAFAQPAPSASPARPAEVPLGSGAPAAANLDLQLPANGGGSSPGGMMDMGMAMDQQEMAMEMGMMSNMMAMEMGAMPGMGSAGGSSSSSMAAMPGMAAAAAPGGELSGQLLATNALLTKLLATLSAQPGGIQAAQLQTINQLLANQAALLQLLLKSGAGAPAAATASMPPGGMGMGMGMMGMGGM